MFRDDIVRQEWFKTGLCRYMGVSGKDGYGNLMYRNCYCCLEVEKLIGSLGDFKYANIFRSLRSSEINALDKGLLSRDISISLVDVNESYHSYKNVLDTLFEKSVDTINDCSIKQYAYSKSAIIPLFGFVKEKNNKKKGNDIERRLSKERPTIIMKVVPLNSFKVSYTCKKDGVIYESSIVVPISTIYSKEVYSRLKKDLFSIRGKSLLTHWSYCLNHLCESIIKKEGISNIADIFNLKISSYIIDLSVIPRNILKGYLQKCFHYSHNLSTYAIYNKYQEVISSEAGSNTVGREVCVIQGKEIMALLQAIVISKLFLKTFKVSNENKSIIESFISKWDSSINVFDYHKSQILINNILSDYKMSMVLLQIVIGVEPYGTSIDYYTILLNNGCISKELVKDVVDSLNEEIGTFNTHYLYHWSLTSYKEKLSKSW